MTKAEEKQHKDVPSRNSATTQERHREEELYSWTWWTLT
jgi:hypothetical protein